MKNKYFLIFNIIVIIFLSIINDQVSILLGDYINLLVIALVFSLLFFINTTISPLRGYQYLIGHSTLIIVVLYFLLYKSEYGIKLYTLIFGIILGILWVLLQSTIKSISLNKSRNSVSEDTPDSLP